MIDLTGQAAVQPANQSGHHTTRFVKLKPSQRPGLASSTLLSKTTFATRSGVRLARSSKTQSFNRLAPSWRADRSCSDASSDDSSQDSSDDEDNGRRPQHPERGAGCLKRRSAGRNMLQVRFNLTLSTALHSFSNWCVLIKQEMADEMESDPLLRKYRAMQAAKQSGLSHSLTM